MFSEKALYLGLYLVLTTRGQARESLRKKNGLVAHCSPSYLRKPLMDFCPLRDVREHPLKEDEHFSGGLKGLPDGFYREVPRDGNCLYQALAVLLYPDIQKNHTATTTCLVSLFDSAGVSPVVYETYIEGIEECVEQKREVAEVVAEEWMLLNATLRLAASSYIRTHVSEFAGFLENKNVHDYVSRNVDPMFKRGGALEINAISRALSLRIEVYQVLRDQCLQICFGEDNDSKAYHILHTPDHFEPFYPHSVSQPTQGTDHKSRI